MCVFSNNAFALTCERTTKSIAGFQTGAAFEAWHPKIIAGRHSESLEWKEIGKGSKSLEAELNMGQHTITYRLLPSNKMLSRIKPRSGFLATDWVYYKCDKNSNEVRQLIASSGSANKPDSNPTSTVEKSCFDGNVANCTKEQLCNRATSTRNGNKEWESINQFQPFVAEAKSRGLSCGVTEPTTSPTSKSKLDKAKSTCTELGFTLGTEKHGECVLKMMDN